MQNEPVPKRAGGSVIFEIVSCTLSCMSKIELHKAENPWRPRPLIRLEQQTHALDDKMEQFVKKMKTILYKLTPENCEKLAKQASDLLEESEEQFNCVIDLVFERAIDVPNLSAFYATLSRCLALKKFSLGTKLKDYISFSKLLVIKCQSEFEKNVIEKIATLNSIIEKKTYMKRRECEDESKDAERNMKRRALGIIRFIGELFKVHMLTASIMHDCIKKLFNQGDDDSLQCLCTLLTIIGKDMDSDKSKSNNTEYTNKDKMNNYFRLLQEIVNERQTSARVRYMLKDVIDLRNNGWVSTAFGSTVIGDDGCIRIDSRNNINAHKLKLRKVNTRMGLDGNIVVIWSRDIIAVLKDIDEDDWIEVVRKNNNFINQQKLKFSKGSLNDDTDLDLNDQNIDICNLSLSSKSSSSSLEIENNADSNGFQMSSSAELLSNPLELPQEKSTQSVTIEENNRLISDFTRNANTEGKIISHEVNIAHETCYQNIADSNESKHVELSASRIAPVQNIDGKVFNQSQEESSQFPEIIKTSVAEESRQVHSDLSRNFHSDVTDGKGISCQATNAAKASCTNKSIPYFLTYSLNCALEKFISLNWQSNQLKLTHDLLSLEALFCLAKDYSVDIPFSWETARELIAPLIKDGTLPLSFLQNSSNLCFKTGCINCLYTFISSMISALSENLGVNEYESDDECGFVKLPQNVVMKKFVRENKNPEQSVSTIFCGDSGRVQMNSEQENTVTVLRGNPNFTKLEIEKKTKALLDRFLRLADFQETIFFISTFCASATISVFVTCALNFVLEQSAEDRQQVGQLMHDLIRSEVMSAEQFVKGLQAILTSAEKNVINNPRIWDYLGEIIAPLVEDRTLSVSFLLEVVEPYFETDCGFSFVSDVLRAVYTKRKITKSMKCGKLFA